MLHSDFDRSRSCCGERVAPWSFTCAAPHKSSAYITFDARIYRLSNPTGWPLSTSVLILYIIYGQTLDTISVESCILVEEMSLCLASVRVSARTSKQVYAINYALLPEVTSHRSNGVGIFPIDCDISKESGIRSLMSK